jgi:hypothetical protein
MEASQHSLLAACFTLHSINATLAIVPQCGAELWIKISYVTVRYLSINTKHTTAFDLIFMTALNIILK